LAGSNDLVLVNDCPSWADTISASQNHVFKLENGISAEQASTLPAFLSAWAILKSSKLQNGDSILLSDTDTSIGQALSQLAKVRGINTLPVSSSDLESKDFGNNFRNKQGADKMKVAVVGSSGKFLHSILKVLPTNGELVVFHGIHQSLDAVTGVEVPIGRAIFQNVSIRGFDYLAWYRNSRDEFNTGLKEITQLVKEKKLSLKPNIVPAADAQKALADTEKTGKLNVLQF
jgi:NADPH:quinone reductase-like Zn-dependent oxidoreductase